MSGPSGGRPQPGWYADPAGKAKLRWWDGSAWTDQTHDLSEQASGAASQGSSPLHPSMATARAWWNRQRWWKWVVAAFASLVVVGAIGDAIDPADSKHPDPAGARPNAQATAIKRAPAAAPAVTRTMIHKDGRFWTKQSAQAKHSLVGYCLSDAKAHADLVDGAAAFVTKLDPHTVIRKLDLYYADKDKHFFGGLNADDPITEPCRRTAEDMSEGSVRAHEQALRNSVEPANFRATTARVRRYFRVNSQSDDLRSVSCAHRTTCTVALNATVGDLGLVGDVVFGSYNRDLEAQLIFDTTELFHRLFHDKRFEHGTVTTWLKVQTTGGKTNRVPALTVTCDRAADRDINWERVGPEGLRRFCDYRLTPIRGIG